MLFNDSVNPVTAIQSWQTQRALTSCLVYRNLICTLEHVAALMSSDLTTIWGNGFLMCHFKVQGTQVKEYEVLYLENE